MRGCARAYSLLARRHGFRTRGDPRNRWAPCPPHARPILLRLAFGLCVAAGLLGATELTLRVAYGPPAPPTLLVADQKVAGRPFDLDGGMITVAYQGRDTITPFSLAPTPGLPRLLVFGGSSVHGGSHLPAALEFPGLVQGALEAEGRRVEVLNLAQPGRDTNSTRPVLAAALAFQPALVVFYMGHNDLGNTIMQARYPGFRGALEAQRDRGPAAQQDP